MDTGVKEDLETINNVQMWEKNLKKGKWRQIVGELLWYF